MTFHIMHISETPLAPDLEFGPPSPSVQDRAEGESIGEAVACSRGPAGVNDSKMAAGTHFMWESAEPLRMHEREGGGGGARRAVWRARGSPCVSSSVLPVVEPKQMLLVKAGYLKHLQIRVPETPNVKATVFIFKPMHCIWVARL